MNQCSQISLLKWICHLYSSWGLLDWFHVSVTHLFGAELMGAAHKVGAEQREGDGVSRLGRQLETLLEHLFKGAAVKAIRDRERKRKWAASSLRRLVQSYLISWTNAPVRFPPSMKEKYLKTRGTTDSCYGLLRTDMPSANCGAGVRQRFLRHCWIDTVTAKRNHILPELWACSLN